MYLLQEVLIIHDESILFPSRGRLILCDKYNVSIAGIQLSNGGRATQSL